MKALSIRQPWAWLICKGYKDIENRGWHIHMPPLLNYPATPRRIYVHTGAKMDLDCWDFVRDRLPNDIWKEIWNSEFINSLALGAIIGEIDITGCVERSDSRWFVGEFGFTLANPMLYDKPIPCKGRPGFFEVPSIL